MRYIKYLKVATLYLHIVMWLMVYLVESVVYNELDVMLLSTKNLPKIYYIDSIGDFRQT